MSGTFRRLNCYIEGSGVIYHSQDFESKVKPVIETNSCPKAHKSTAKKRLRISSQLLVKYIDLNQWNVYHR